MVFQLSFFSRFAEKIFSVTSARGVGSLLLAILARATAMPSGHDAAQPSFSSTDTVGTKKACRIYTLQNLCGIDRSNRDPHHARVALDRYSDRGCIGLGQPALILPAHL